MERKWRCQRCTFENYPASLKCTICFLLKPNYAEENNERDIYKMATLSLDNNSSINSSSRNFTDQQDDSISPRSLYNSEKWSCMACTYLNWPKAQKCVQCLTSKPKSKSSSPTGRCSNDENIARGPSPTELMNKWSCRNCTLDNLYKTTKCTACGTHRKRPSSPFCDKGATSSVSNRQQTLYHQELLWLNACRGVLDGNINAVQAYLTSGGSPGRSLTNDECAILERPSAFQANQNLVHLAIRFKREDILALILASNECSKPKKRLPPHVSPDIADEILKQFSSLIRIRKGEFGCLFVTDTPTYSLPMELDQLSNEFLNQFLDKDVQKELEEDEMVINWNPQISHLYALWNRTSGDCLLDSVLQCAFGVFDIKNTLRQALAESLLESGHFFERRWRECEVMAARALHFMLDESQLSNDWQLLVQASKTVGTSLEHIHVFVLAHIMRRPIIVYSIKWVKSWRGEKLAPACFEGVFLPLLWEISFCSKSPLALGYTRGHFSALVALGPHNQVSSTTDDESFVSYLPLTDKSGNLLPIHFLSPQQRGCDESLLRTWLDCSVTTDGYLVTKQVYNRHRLSALVTMMNDKWLCDFIQMHGTNSATSGHILQRNESDAESDIE